jgi:hypothetical protein
MDLLRQEARSCSLEAYYVTIPPGIRGGQSFDAFIESRLVSIQCPQTAVDLKDIACDRRLEIQVLRMQGRPTHYRIASYYDKSHTVGELWSTDEEVTEAESQGRTRSVYLTCWVFLDIALIILLVMASLSRPSFAVQHISAPCGVVNDRNGKQVHSMYYNFWSGYGSTWECQNSDDQYWYD